MWPFRSSNNNRIATASIIEKDGRVHIDVKGQSCPNYTGLHSTRGAIAAARPRPSYF